TPSCDLFIERVHAEDRPELEHALERAITERQAFAIDHRIVLPDGSVRYLHNQGHPISSSGENRVELVGTVMDITERKQGQDALRKAHDALAHATRVMTMGELTASIAHELNQPLAAIVANYTAGQRYLRAEPPNVAETRDALRDIS